MECHKTETLIARSIHSDCVVFRDVNGQH